MASFWEERTASSCRLFLFKATLCQGNCPACTTHPSAGLCVPEQLKQDCSVLGSSAGQQCSITMRISQVEIVTAYICWTRWS